MSRKALWQVKADVPLALRYTPYARWLRLMAGLLKRETMALAGLETEEEWQVYLLCRKAVEASA